MKFYLENGVVVMAALTGKNSERLMAKPWYSVFGNILQKIYLVFPLLYTVVPHTLYHETKSKYRTPAEKPIFRPSPYRESSIPYCFVSYFLGTVPRAHH